MGQLITGPFSFMGSKKINHRVSIEVLSINKNSTITLSIRSFLDKNKMNIENPTVEITPGQKVWVTQDIEITFEGDDLPLTFSRSKPE